jgi:hypothetical protein
MASQRNPEGQPSPTESVRVGVKVKRGGSQERPSIPVTGGPTRGSAATVSSVGTEDRNQPESGRARQDAANGTVHGQPRSGYNDGDNIRR